MVLGRKSSDETLCRIRSFVSIRIDDDVWLGDRCKFFSWNIMNEIRLIPDNYSRIIWSITTAHPVFQKICTSQWTAAWSEFIIGFRNSRFLVLLLLLLILRKISPFFLFTWCYWWTAWKHRFLSLRSCSNVKTGTWRSRSNRYVPERKCTSCLQLSPLSLLKYVWRYTCTMVHKRNLVVQWLRKQDSAFWIRDNVVSSKWFRNWRCTKTINFPLFYLFLIEWNKEATIGNT